MVTVKYIPNIFNEDGRKEVELPYSRAKSIADFAKEAGISLEGQKVIVSGKRIKNVTNPVDNHDEILITPDVKEPISTLAWLAWTAIVSFATAHPFIFWAFVLSTSYAVYSYMTTPTTPGFNLGGVGNDQGSPTYDLEGVQTTQEAGAPIAIIYGQHIFGGVKLNEFVTTDGDEVFYNVLLGIGEGEFPDDYISDIKINDNDIDNFDGVTQTIKTGTNDQAVIPHFENLNNLYTVNQELTKNNAYTYTTTNTDVEGFELHFRTPNGLFQQAATGQIAAWSVTYQVEYKLHSAGSWTDLGSTTITAKSRTVLRRVFKKQDIEAGQYDIRITKTSDDSSLSPVKTGDFYLYQVNEIQTDSLSYPNLGLLALENISAKQLSGSPANFTFVVKGRKVRVPDIQYGGGPVDWEDYYWDSSSEQWKLLENDAVCSWDGVSYTTAWSANPVWCLRDLITNDRFGLGQYIETAQINDTKMLEMAKICEEKVDDGESGYEKRYRLDIVIDTRTKALDLLIQICATFDASPVYSAGGIFFGIDYPDDSPAMQFGEGNIIKDSFNQAIKSYTERYNWVNINYVDASKGYKPETVTYIDEESIVTNGDPIREKNLRIFVTKTSYAVRAARRAIKIAKYIDRTYSFQAGPDAIGIQAMDTIYLAHPFIVAESGTSGRVATGSTTTVVQLDKSVTLESGETYKLQIKFADDTMEEQTVIDGPGTYTEVEVGSAFSQAPAAYDNYILGKTGVNKKQVRVISLERTKDHNVQINAIEYDEDVYDDSAPTIPTSNWEELTTGIPLVSDVVLTEGEATANDGTVENTIQVWWQKPVQEDYDPLNKWKGARVYISSDGGDTYYPANSGNNFSDGVSFTIHGDLEIGQQYYIKVTSVAWNDDETSIADSPGDDITLAGKQSAPDDIDSFAYTFGKTLILGWDDVTNPDLAGYEIRDENANWGVDNANLIYRGRVNKFEYTPSTRTPGTLYIKAFNTSGVYSASADDVTPTNAAPSAPTISAVVFFNLARIDWTDIGDGDITEYEVYISETNAWAGEEALYKRVVGKSAYVKGNKSVAGSADSATSSSITDATLAGYGTDYFVGDKVIITDGDDEGDEVTVTAYNTTTGEFTISGTFATTPSAGDNFFVVDVKYVKVRAKDPYGAGTFSSASTLTFEVIDEDMLGDEIIVARKLYSGEIITLSAQIADAIILDGHIETLNVSKLVGGTITGQDIILGADGIFRSENYVEGTTGFKLDPVNGLEINDGIIRGDLVLIGGAVLQDLFTITTQNTLHDSDTDWEDTGYSVSNVTVESDHLHLTFGQTSGYYISPPIQINGVELKAIQWSQFLPLATLDLCNTYGTATAWWSSGPTAVSNPGRAIDLNDTSQPTWGDGSTHWGQYAYVDVDLGEARWVSKIRLYQHAYASYGVKVQHSDNGVDWTDVGSMQYNSGEKIQEITPVKKRYWRARTSNFAENYDSIWIKSFELYAYAENPTITVKTRTADNSSMSGATDWEPSEGYDNPGGTTMVSDTDTYIQYRIDFATDNATDMYPIVNWVRVNYDTVLIENADKVDGFDASQTPTADTILVLDGSGYIPSAAYAPGEPEITQAELQTTTGEINRTSAGSSTLPGGTYGFYPQVKLTSPSYPSGGPVSIADDIGDLSSSYTTKIGVNGNVGGANNIFYAQQRYVTATSADYWCYMLRRKSDGLIVERWIAHDPACYGTGKTEDELPHPFGQINESEYEAILIDNSFLDEAKQMVTKEKSLLQVIAERFIVDDISSPHFTERKVKEIDQYGDMPGKVVQKIKTPEWAKIVISEKTIAIKERTITELPQGVLYKKLKLKGA